MTCEPHREAEELDRRLEEEQRRERESWGAPAPVEPSPARVDQPATVDELTADLMAILLEPVDEAEPATVPNSPYPPAPPTVDEQGRITFPLNLRGGR